MDPDFGNRGFQAPISPTLDKSRLFDFTDVLYLWLRYMITFSQLQKKRLKKIFPRIIIDLWGQYKYHSKISRFRGKQVQDVFKEIHTTNHWKNTESISGPGSTLLNTEQLIPALNDLLDRLVIKHLIDAPCGDFNWIKNIDLKSLNYVGLDIVPELIASNIKKYASSEISFQVQDIIKDPLRETDLILCRDCLVHFCYDDIFKTISNFKKSGSTYLLTTTFTIPRINFDIHTGDWRPLNLERPPFNFPPPLYTIDDFSNRYGVVNELNKILGLWKLTDLNCNGKPSF